MCASSEKRWCLWFCDVVQLQYCARAAEILVDGRDIHVVRKREVIKDLWALKASLNKITTIENKTRSNLSKCMAGNDFMVIDCARHKMYLSPEKIKQLADRNFGIGFDQLLPVEPLYDDQDFHYRIFTADGSEEQCGNGAQVLLAL